METHSTLKTSGAEDREIEIISTFPQESKPYWRPTQILHKYQGFWCYKDFLKGVILFQKNFKPQPNDILICTIPKSGFTWLKSLCVAISTRSLSENPLLTTMPHDSVPVQELLYSVGHERDTINNPLISSHLPFNSLPKSILLNSNTKIIYVCRNPKDVLVSLWHFLGGKKAITFQEGYEKFCNGVSSYGPYWDHVLGYWKASLEFPERVLFLKYEDMKNDTCFYVKRIGDFMGCGFSEDELKQGVPEKIAQFCSFESLSNLKVNKSKDATKYVPIKMENSSFFRKGEIGDWKNHLTAEMAERLDQIIQDKFRGTGLIV